MPKSKVKKALSLRRWLRPQSIAVAAGDDEACEGILLAARSAGAVPVDVVRDGLCGMRLHADVALETPRQIGDGVEIELVALVAIGVGIFGGEVEQIRVAEGERIALVGVVILVDGISVVGVEEEAVAHALAQADRKTAIERLRGTDRVGDVAEVREDSVNAGVGDGVGASCGQSKAGTRVGIGEARQVDAFDEREVGVGRVVAD